MSREWKLKVFGIKDVIADEEMALIDKALAMRTIMERYRKRWETHWKDALSELKNLNASSATREAIKKQKERVEYNYTMFNFFDEAVGYLDIDETDTEMSVTEQIDAGLKDIYDEADRVRVWIG